MGAILVILFELFLPEFKGRSRSRILDSLRRVPVVEADIGIAAALEHSSATEGPSYLYG